MTTLRDLAERVLGWATLDVALGDFLDAFYRDPEARMLTDEPKSLAGLGEDGEAYDAYLAAVAERLARTYRLGIPGWVFGANRYLHRPVFGTESAAMRATLLLESPPEFRSRNIVVTANAIDRTSRHAA